MSSRSRQPSPRFRLELAERLRGRRAEIEQAIRVRVYALSDPNESGDPQYVDGLRTAIATAIEYAIGAVEEGDAWRGPIPGELFAQARHAARSGVSLPIVLNRYFAGNAIFGDFLMGEAAKLDVAGAEELKELGKTQNALFEDILQAIPGEYQREAEGRDPGRLQVRLVRRLLSGELADVAPLPCDFEAWHVGVVAIGPEADGALRQLAARLGRRLFVVWPDGNTAWAWLFGGEMVPRAEIAAAAAATASQKATLATGESAQGLSGWRMTHQQAAAALLVAARRPLAYAHYADVALEASSMQDELLVRSLYERYLLPLTGERDRGETLRQTLRAYFAAERKISSTAFALKIDRKTVVARLRRVERLVGGTIPECAAELELALRLEALNLTTT